LGRRHDQ